MTIALIGTPDIILLLDHDVLDHVQDRRIVLLEARKDEERMIIDHRRMTHEHLQ